MVKQYIDQTITLTPSRLEIERVSSRDIIQCYSIAFTKDGDLIVGFKNGVALHTIDGRRLQVFETDTPVTSVSTVSDSDDIVYVKSQNNSEANIKVVSLLKSLEKSEELFSFASQNTISNIAASKNLVVTGKDQYLVIYDKNSKLKSLRTMQFKPRKLQFHTDNHLLVSDISYGKLRMFDMQNTENPKLLWRCTGLAGIDGLCMVDNGLIMAKAISSRNIFVISAQGKASKNYILARILDLCHLPHLTL